MKTLSCGIFIIDENEQQILLCHVTGKNFYDIPKGMSNEGETEVETALRETKEEANLSFSENDLIDMGHHNFNKRKNIHVFKVLVNKKDIHLNELKCNTTFINQVTKQEQLEMDGYQWFDLSEAAQYVSKSLAKLFSKLISEQKINKKKKHVI